jgi:hypothetical protein
MSYSESEHFELRAALARSIAAILADPQTQARMLHIADLYDAMSRAASPLGLRPANDAGPTTECQAPFIWSSP